MRLSRLFPALAFLGLVPVTLWVAYAGSGAGLYPHSAIPIVFAVAFAVGVVVVFVVLSTLRERLA